jgi:hypothetical protein
VSLWWFDDIDGKTSKKSEYLAKIREKKNYILKKLFFPAFLFLNDYLQY